VTTLDKVGRIFCATFALDTSRFHRGIVHGELKKWDSIGHLSMITAMEKEFGVEFDVDDIMEMQSVEAILITLARKGVPE
jgi:acyl carrier protein